MPLSFAAPSTALDCSGSYAITGTVPLQLSPGAPFTESSIDGQIQLLESNGQFADNITFNNPFGATGSLWGVIDGSGAVTATFQIANAQGSLVVGTQGTASSDCSLIKLHGMSAGQPVSLTLVPSARVPTATPTLTTGPPTYDCTGLYGVTGAPLRLTGTSQLSDMGGSVTGAMTLTAPVATSGLVTATVDPSGGISGTISLQYSGFTFIPLTGQATPGCLTATLTATLNLLGNVITETVTLTQFSGPTPTPTGFPVTATPTAQAVTPTNTSTPGATMPDCTGVYSVAGTVPILGQVGGQATLRQTAGLITGPLTITGLITVTGAVTATVSASGAISGTLALPIPGFKSVPATGQATPDCSSANLTATIGASTAAFTLTRVSGGPTATPTSTSFPAATATWTAAPTHTPTIRPTNTPTTTPTRAATATPTDTPTRIPTATPTNTATSRPSAVVALNVKSAWPFHRVVLTGLYFGATEPVAVYWDSLHTSPLTVTRTLPNGAFQVTLSVPQAISGTHVIVALGLQSARYAATTLRVVPELTLVPASGAPGGRFVIVGVGFGANEPLTAYWDHPPGSLGTTVSNAQGSAIGADAITATVPLSATAGQHVVYATGWKSHGLASATFTVP